MTTPSSSSAASPREDKSPEKRPMLSQPTIASLPVDPPSPASSARSFSISPTSSPGPKVEEDFEMDIVDKESEPHPADPVTDEPDLLEPAPPPSPSIAVSTTPVKRQVSLDDLQVAEGGKNPGYAIKLLIEYAIRGSVSGMLSLSGIYEAIEKRYPHLKTSRTWRNSARHDISWHPRFVKVQRPSTEPGRGCFWTINPNPAYAEPSQPVLSSAPTRATGLTPAERRRAKVKEKGPSGASPHPVAPQPPHTRPQFVVTLPPKTPPAATPPRPPPPPRKESKEMQTDA
ncbi:hypothetical protein FRC03_008963 [Tulasnella sp. 419]|nr:hypothetical protein FRC02_006368 [Tulasnella sp. 418]KAG8958604.1 hypothetical protein FRC03_008963 [Tulasnella sp. 419]